MVTGGHYIIILPTYWSIPTSHDHLDLQVAIAKDTVETVHTTNWDNIPSYMYMYTETQLVSAGVVF